MLLNKARILVVDDDPDVLTAVSLLLKKKAKEVVTEKRPDNIRNLSPKDRFDVILLDMNFTASINTGNEGLFWLRELRKMKITAAVIMITAYGDIDLAVRSLKEGADDFIIKPWQNEKLIAALEEVLAKKTQAKTTDIPSASDEIIGQSEVMQNIYRKLEKVAPTEANVLILGENGTGKELIANAIHRKSQRYDKAFVKIDVGALTESLFESELFGHKKGAFTDARENRIGRFEAAQGGTLFLDEIGNISLQQQAKLLTVLQNRQIIPIGANEPVPIDIRLICATNLPLSELSNEAHFRKDLIYRINTVELIIPPLRQRGNDVIILAEHFLKLYTKKYLKNEFHFDKSAIERLKSYTFPGNVRELQYTVERAVVMSDRDVLSAAELFFSSIEGRELTAAPNLTLNEMERETILEVIEKHHGNITQAAKELGLTRTALYRRLNKYDL